jgi:hypothetical protein
MENKKLLDGFKNESDKIFCICGAVISKNNKTHIESKMHINYLHLINPNPLNHILFSSIESLNKMVQQHKYSVYRRNRPIIYFNDYDFRCTVEEIVVSFNVFLDDFRRNLNDYHREKKCLLNNISNIFNIELKQHKIAVLLNEKCNFIYDIALTISEYI